LIEVVDKMLKTSRARDVCAITTAKSRLRPDLRPFAWPPDPI
jgi:hypothetical protein